MWHLLDIVVVLDCLHLSPCPLTCLLDTNGAASGSQEVSDLAFWPVYGAAAVFHSASEWSCLSTHLPDANGATALSRSQGVVLIRSIPMLMVLWLCPELLFSGNLIFWPVYLMLIVLQLCPAFRECVLTHFPTLIVLWPCPVLRWCMIPSFKLLSRCWWCHSHHFHVSPLLVLYHPYWSFHIFCRP